MKKQAKAFVLGVLLTLALTSSVQVIASTMTKQITAYYNNIKVVVDGKQLETAADSEPFIVDGRVFLPVRAVGEAFGKNVEWDGSSYTVFVGEKPGAQVYLPDVCPAYTSSDGYAEYSALKSGGKDSINMGGEAYTNALYWNNWYYEGYAVYNLNGKYSQFSGIIGRKDGQDYNNKIEFYCDGTLRKTVILQKGAYQQNFTLDLTGVLQLKIVGAFYNENEKKQYNSGNGDGIRCVVIANPVLK